MRRPRRQMNQINVVPYIDVMLVLLVIFMVTAPMIQSGSVNLPSVDKVPAAPQDAMIVQVAADGELTFRRNGADPGREMSKKALIAEIRRVVEDNPAQPVVIAADKAVRYELVMDTLNDLRNAGVNQVGLQTQIGKSAR